MLQSDLHSALSFVTRVTSPRHELLSCVRLEASDGELSLECMNGRSYAGAIVPCEATLEATLFPARLLSQVVSRMHEEISLSIKWGGLCLEDDRSKLRVRSFAETKDFPSLPPVEPTGAGKLFLEPLTGVLDAVSSWSKSLERAPLCVYPVSGGCYTANSSTYASVWGAPEGDHVPIMIEDFSLIRWMLGEDDVELSWNDRRVEFKSSGRIVSIQMSSLNTPDVLGLVDGFFSLNDGKYISVDTRELVDAIRLSSPVVGGELSASRSIEISVEGDHLALKLQSDIGGGEVSVPVIENNLDKEATAIVTPGYLADVLSGMPSDLDIYFGNGKIGLKSPWIRKVLATKWK